jgi:tripartite-type tricarboxylate transporter receptor subunit TctC
MTRPVSITRRTALAVGALALSLGTANMSMAQDVSFEGETVEIMVNFAAGGGTDTAARLVAPFIAQHLPGNPDVIVTNRGGAGGTAAVDYLIDSMPPDGLHIGYFAGTPIRWALGLQQVPEGTGDLPFVAARSVNQIFIARNDAELDFDTAPGYEGPLFMALNSPDNHVAIRARLLAEAIGIDEFELITGYRGQGNMVAAARSQETEIAQTNDSFFGANRDAITGDDVLSPWGQMGEYVDGSIVSQVGLEDIPVFDQLWRSASPETLDSPAYAAWEAIHIAMSIQNVFVLPPNTPEEFIPAWEAAVLAAYSDPGYIAQLAQAGVPQPAAVGTEDVLNRMAALRVAFENPDIIAAIEDAIATNSE